MNRFPFDGRPIFEGHLGSISHLAFSPDSQFLASASPSDGSVRLWHVDSGQIGHIFSIEQSNSSPHGLTFSQDAKTLYAVDQTGLRSWNVESGRPAKTRKIGSFAMVEFSKSGRFMAIRKYRKDQVIVQVRDVESFRLLKTYEPPEPDQDCDILGFSVDEQFVVLGFENGTVVFNIASGEKHIGTETSPDDLFSPTHFCVLDGRQAAMRVRGDSMQIHDLLTGKLMKEIDRKGQPWNALNATATFHLSQRIIVSSFYKGASVVDLESGQTIADFPRYMPWYRSVAVSRNDHLLAFGSDDGSIEVVQTVDWQRKSVIGAPPEPSSIAVDPTGRYLGIVWEHSGTLFWDLEKLELIGSSPEPVTQPRRTKGQFAIRMNGSVEMDKVAFQLPSGQWLVYYQSLKALRILEDENTLIPEVVAADTILRKRRIAWPPNAALSQNGEWLGITKPKRILLYNLKTGLKADMRSNHDFGVRWLSVSNNGNIALAQHIGTACLFDVRKRKIVCEVDVLDTSGPVAVSPDGKVLAAGDLYGLPMVAKAGSRKRRISLDGHCAGARSLAFTPDRNLLITAAGDGQVIVWDTNTWTRKATLMTYRGTSDPVWIAYTEDGHWNGSPILAEAFRKSPESSHSDCSKTSPA